MMIGAFYIFNDEVLDYVPSHFALNFALAHSSSSVGGKKADAQSTLRLLRCLKGASEKIVPPFADMLASPRPQKSRSPEEVRSSLNEMALIRMGCSSISNPGSVGQMANLALDKYYPFDDLMGRILGFRSVEAVRTVRMLQKSMERQFPEKLSEDTIQKIRTMRSHKREMMLIPPREFLLVHSEACTLTAEDLDQKERLFAGPLRKLVQFLSVGLDDARNQGGFLHRWCFLRQSENKFLLPLPIHLMETLVSAIHAGLLAGMDEHEKGEFGLKTGRIFEDIVADRFRRYLPESKVTPRHEVKAAAGLQDIPDVDVLVEMPDGGLLLVLCRAKALKYRTKWGDKENFKSDFRRNLHEQAGQFTRILHASPELLPRIRACFAVTEASFPGISGFIRSESSLGMAFRNLPNPFVLDLYDLELVMSYIDPGKFSDYLDWHNKAVNLKELLVLDETDFVAAYHQHRDDPDFFEKTKNKPAFLSVTDYSDFSTRTLSAVDRRLGIPPGPY
jgi:hypothetical protein